MRKIKTGDIVIYKEDSKTLEMGQILRITIGSIYSRNKKEVNQCDIDENPNGLVFTRRGLIFFNQIMEIVSREGK